MRKIFILPGLVMAAMLAAGCGTQPAADNSSSSSSGNPSSSSGGSQAVLLYTNIHIIIPAEDVVYITGISNLTYSTDMTIPATINGRRVDEILDYAFTNNQYLTGITIPNGTVQVRTAAFKDCSNLVRASLPDSVTFLGGSAFENCSLESFRFPTNLTAIGSYTFRNCKFTSLVIPIKINIIPNLCFTGNPITNITILSTNPPFISPGGSSFPFDTNVLVSIRVPAGSLQYYTNKWGWTNAMYSNLLTEY